MINLTRCRCSFQWKFIYLFRSILVRLLFYGTFDTTIVARSTVYVTLASCASHIKFSLHNHDPTFFLFRFYSWQFYEAKKCACKIIMIKNHTQNTNGPYFILHMEMLIFPHFHFIFLEKISLFVGKIAFLLSNSFGFYGFWTNLL